jgi:hypothetical protein
MSAAERFERVSLNRTDGAAYQNETNKSITISNEIFDSLWCTHKPLHAFNAAMHQMSF